MLERIVLALAVLFPISELALGLLKRSRRGEARADDRGSLWMLWFTILSGVALALAAQSVRAARLPLSPSSTHWVALALLIVGLATRWTAILTLGRFFTVDVAIHDEHAVIQHGLYRYMRHPSYTGLFITLLGLGVYFGNWLSIVAIFVPAALAVRHRVSREERALLQALGPAYADYCMRTRRFIPGVV